MKDHWKTVLLGPEATMVTAAEVLTQSSMRIVLVVSENDCLLGTVTDGDIRRALVRGFPMETQIDKIMETNPITVSLGEDRRTVLKLMREKDLLQVPILDKENKVVGLDVMQDLVRGATKENPVLLMAGGFGKRLHPLTKDLPKPLLTVGSKPILQSTIERLADEGFSRFYLAVHYKADLVRKHFGDGSQWGISISYLIEKEPLGTAGALGSLKAEPIKEPLVVMNGDILTQLDFNQLLEYHERCGGVATMCICEYDFQIPYGVVKSDGSYVREIIEKPAQKFSVNAGIYVLNPELVHRSDFLQPKNMPDFLQEIIEDGKQVNMFPIHEYWLDIGRLEEYQQAQIDVSDFRS